MSGDYSIEKNQEEEAALVCSWPFFHNDIAILKETGKVVHVVQGQLVNDPLRDTRIRRKQGRIYWGGCPPPLDPKCTPLAQVAPPCPQVAPPQPGLKMLSLPIII